MIQIRSKTKIPLLSDSDASSVTTFCVVLEQCSRATNQTERMCAARALCIAGEILLQPGVAPNHVGRY